MPTINQKNWPEIKKLYESGFPMSKIARHFDVTLDAVTYAMRKAKIERRTIKEAHALLFKQKPMSFEIKKLKTQGDKQVVVIGVSLYWAEGYKTSRSYGIDFANSDPSMIEAFMKFLRTCYKLDEKRLRIQMYAYGDQNIEKLIAYWSKLTSIPRSQFTKPYVRSDFRVGGRKMTFGLIHVRYSDKKMLFDILKRIEDLKRN